MRKPKERARCQEDEGCVWGTLTTLANSDTDRNGNNATA